MVRDGDRLAGISEPWLREKARCDTRTASKKRVKCADLLASHNSWSANGKDEK